MHRSHHVSRSTLMLLLVLVLLCSSLSPTTNLLLFARASSSLPTCGSKYSWITDGSTSNDVRAVSLPHPRKIELSDCELTAMTRLVVVTDPAQGADSPLLIHIRNVYSTTGLFRIGAEEGATNQNIQNLLIDVRDSIFDSPADVFSVKTTNNNLPVADPVVNVSIVATNVTVLGTSYDVFSILSASDVNSSRIVISDSTIHTKSRVGVVMATGIHNVAVESLGTNTIEVAGNSDLKGVGAFGFIHSGFKTTSSAAIVFCITDSHASIFGDGTSIVVQGERATVIAGIAFTLGTAASTSLFKIQARGLQLRIEGNNLNLVATGAVDTAAVGGISIATNSFANFISLADSQFSVSGDNIKLYATSIGPQAAAFTVLGTAQFSSSSSVATSLQNHRSSATGTNITLMADTQGPAASILGVGTISKGDVTSATASVTVDRSAFLLNGTGILADSRCLVASAVLGVAVTCEKCAETLPQFSISIIFANSEMGATGSFISLFTRSAYSSAILGLASQISDAREGPSFLEHVNSSTTVAGHNIRIENFVSNAVGAIVGEAVQTGDFVSINLANVTRLVVGEALLLALPLLQWQAGAIIGTASYSPRRQEISLVEVDALVNGSDVTMSIVNAHSAATIGGIASRATVPGEKVSFSSSLSSVCVSLADSTVRVSGRGFGFAVFGVAIVAIGPTDVRMLDSSFIVAEATNTTFTVDTPNGAASILSIVVRTQTESTLEFVNSHLGILSGDHLSLSIIESSPQSLTAILSISVMTPVRTDNSSLLVHNSSISAFLSRSSLSVLAREDSAAILSIGIRCVTGDAVTSVVVRESRIVFEGDYTTITAYAVKMASFIASVFSVVANSDPASPPVHQLLDSSEISIIGSHLIFDALADSHGSGVLAMVVLGYACSSRGILTNAQLSLVASNNVTLKSRGDHGVATVGVTVGHALTSELICNNSKIGAVGGNSNLIAVTDLYGGAIVGIATYHATLGNQTIYNTTIAAASLGAGRPLTIGVDDARTLGDRIAAVGILSFVPTMSIIDTNISAHGPGMLFNMGTVHTVAPAGIFTALEADFVNARLDYCSVSQSLGTMPTRRTAAFLKAVAGSKSGELDVTNTDIPNVGCPTTDSNRWIEETAWFIVNSTRAAVMGCDMHGLGRGGKDDDVSGQTATATLVSRSPTSSTSDSLSLEPTATGPHTPTVAELPKTATPLQSRTATAEEGVRTITILPPPSINDTTTAAPPTPEEPSSSPTQEPTLQPATAEPATVVRKVDIRTVLPVSSSQAEALEGSTAVSTALSGGLTSPTASANVARIGAALRSIDCPLSEDDPRPSVVEHPIQFELGSGNLKWYSGATLGSTILLLFAFVPLVVMSHVESFRDKAPVALFKLAAIFSAVSHAYFMPNICGTSTTLMVHGTSSTDRIVAILCLLLVCGMFGYYLYFINNVAPVVLHVVAEGTTKKRTLSSSGGGGGADDGGSDSSEDDDEDDDEGSSSSSSSSRSEKMVLAEHNNSSHPQQHHFLDRFGMLIDATTKINLPLARNYYAVDVVVASLCTIAAGTRPNGNCMSVAVAIAVLSAASLLYHGYIRPFERKLDHFFAVLIAVNPRYLGSSHDRCDWRWRRR